SPSAAYGPITALQACDLSADGRLAVTASDDLAAPDGSQSAPRLRGEIRLWGVSSPNARRIGQLTVDGAVQAVALCPTDPALVLVAGNQSADKAQPGYAAALFRWNGHAWDQEQQLGSHPRGIIRGRFSRDGQRI